jgi:hypothetical protein
MDKYNIIIGILLLMIIFDNKMVEGLTMEVCDIHENKFKKLEEKISSMDGKGGVVINNHACNGNDDDDEDDADGDEDDEHKKIIIEEKESKMNMSVFFDYVPKILIGILLSIFLYYIIDYFFLKKKKITAMTYDEALQEVKNAKVLNSKGIKLK